MIDLHAILIVFGIGVALIVFPFVVDYFREKSNDGIKEYVPGHIAAAQMLLTFLPGIVLVVGSMGACLINIIIWCAVALGY
jgi:uncharacterized membrane protein